MSQLFVDCEQRVNKSYDEHKTAINDLLKTVEKVTDERAKFLKEKPWWNRVFEDFQKFLEAKFPGTHVVAFPSNDAVDSLLRVNTVCVPDEKTQLKKMTRSACHDNCYKLYKKDRSNKVYTGYALSADGLWRNHSWIIKDGSIIETTEKRVLYLGYCQAD
ncbi:hypothetical protein YASMINEVIRUS_100 [Yasminevirus sp. GU-2018]|uniref:Uncharacterized protein n=1 Tax=Yasminevirus sp. GU-2018 TaxID=2420051 RepID=A0A5K0U7C6_9VIRU|nr:hypothetical protein YASMINEVIRUS_100 [Yasminevirus sp. GU-2018]